MSYTRKTKDVWVLQGYYGSQYGWEDTTEEDTWREMRDRLKEYRANAPEYSYRAVKRRERVEPCVTPSTIHSLRPKH